MSRVSFQTHHLNQNQHKNPMTTRTDSKIQQIQELITNLKQDLKTEVTQIDNHLNDLQPKNIETDNKLMELSYKLHITQTKLESSKTKIESNKIKIEALDKRLRF